MKDVRWLFWRLIKLLGVGFILLVGLFFGLQALASEEPLGVFQALLTRPQDTLSAMLLLGMGAFFFEDRKASLMTGREYEAHCERLGSVLVHLKEGRRNAAMVQLEITVRGILNRLYFGK